MKSKTAKLPKAKKFQLKGNPKRLKSHEKSDNPNFIKISDAKNRNEVLIKDDEDEFDLASDNSDEEVFVGGDSDEFDEENASKIKKRKKIEDFEDDDDDDDNDDDGSEIEADIGGQSDGLVTSSLIKQLEKNFSNKVNVLSSFKCLQQVLAAALNSISQQKKNREIPSIYVIQDPIMFNAAVRLCLKYVPDTLYPLFCLKSPTDVPKKSRKNKLIYKTLRNFIANFASLTGAVTEPDALVLILKKGILPLLPFYTLLPKAHVQLTHHLITLWGTGQEKVRVLSLMALFRLIQSLNEQYKDNVFKRLYITYISSCRFTSAASWPVIDFMRCSLVELFSLDQVLAYRHSFIFVRQLAVHLRNAMLDPSKQKIQLVYNWQFLHSLNLWVELLVKTYPSEILQPMIYPLTQICLGVIQLQHTPQYFPMTFHICRILTELSAKTRTFIPVLPHLMQILSCPALHQTPSKAQCKPLPWDCIIKLSEPQIKNALFIEGVIDQVFNCTLAYLNTMCCSIAFPELVIPLKIEIQSFKKKSISSEQKKKMTQLLKKVVENSEFIEHRRRGVSFGISAQESIKNWEIEVEQTPPPLRAFFLQWKKMMAELNRMEKLNIVNQCNLEKFTVNNVRRRFLEDQSTWEKKEEERKKNLVSYHKEKVAQSDPKASENQNDAADEEDDEVAEMKLSDLENSDDENMDAQNDSDSADEKDIQEDDNDDDAEDDMYESDEEEEDQ